MANNTGEAKNNLGFPSFQVCFFSAIQKQNDVLIFSLNIVILPSFGAKTKNSFKDFQPITKKKIAGKEGSSLRITYMDTCSFTSWSQHVASMSAKFNLMLSKAVGIQFGVVVRESV